MTETTEVERETVKEETYRGVSYTIVRTNEEEWASSGFEYEFVLYMNDMHITSASQLETAGWSNPWIDALSRYAEAYIDGGAV